MKKHTKIYMAFFNFKIPSDCSCEVCFKHAVDIHHIKARGMGGSKDKDNINNLMAVCRDCHLKYGDVPNYVDFLIDKHKLFIKINKSGISNVGNPFDVEIF